MQGAAARNSDHGAIGPTSGTQATRSPQSGRIHQYHMSQRDVPDRGQGIAAHCPVWCAAERPRNSSSTGIASPRELTENLGQSEAALLRRRGAATHCLEDLLKLLVVDPCLRCARSYGPRCGSVIARQRRPDRRRRVGNTAGIKGGAAKASAIGVRTPIEASQAYGRGAHSGWRPVGKPCGGCEAAADGTPSGARARRSRSRHSKAACTYLAPCREGYVHRALEKLSKLHIPRSQPPSGLATSKVRSRQERRRRLVPDREGTEQ